MTELSDEVLRDLQRSLLAAVLLDRPLPGAGRAPAFGDRAFLLDRPDVVVLDENLAPGLSLEESPRPLRVLSRDDLLAETRREGDLPYLRFSAPEPLEDAVRLTLEARMATADPQRHPIGLSTLQATFRRDDGRWESAGEAVLAN
jgi:hypothetical protein